jgi:hypothetical protein
VHTGLAVNTKNSEREKRRKMTEGNNKVMKERQTEKRKVTGSILDSKKTKD